MRDHRSTRRLRFYPMTDEQLSNLHAAETDPELSQAYLEMLQGCQQHPTTRLWYTAWQITLRDGTPIGDYCFKGTTVNGEVELGYGLLKPYWGQGYATEAAQAAVEWAFKQSNVWFVSAQTEPSNVASQKVLHKIGFTPDGMGEEGPRFVKEKPASQWIPLYMTLGMGMGVSVGSATSNIGLTISLGMLVGLALGTMLDARDRAQRARIKALHTESAIPSVPPVHEA